MTRVLVGYATTEGQTAKIASRIGDETLLAGALKYRSHGVLERFLMKLIAKHSGGDTDTSRDYEYTDWAAVDAFARHFAGHLDEVAGHAEARARRSTAS